MSDDLDLRLRTLRKAFTVVKHSGVNALVVAP
jgi:hypothetical protein